MLLVGQQEVNVRRLTKTLTKNKKRALLGSFA